MEGDAGASRLNPSPMPMFRRLRRLARKSSQKSQQEPTVAADQAGPELTAEGSGESDGENQTAQAATVEASTEAGDGADATAEAATVEASTEPGDETERIDTDEAALESVESAESAEAQVAAEAGDVQARRPSRLGRGWKAGIAAALVLCAVGLGLGGLAALKYHHETQAIARNDAAALKAAVDCVSATQAPDTNAMAASEQKIINCGTDAFRSQALLYTSMLVQAYQASNVHVQVSDVRAAVERNNNDGSVEVLVAMRVKVSTDKSQNETGYRLRVKMALAEGEYKISKLDQVTK